jgi:ABC-2 type transport system ATP-binding protein
MADLVICTEGISKSFRGKLAVRDVSLRVPTGSVYAFLGPNGAGKSTTIRMLLGLLQPTSGNVSLFGQELKHNRSEILARTGSLVESPSLYGHLTARENLEIPRRILGAPHSDIDRVLKVVDLKNNGHQLVNTFSLGMKQRLGLALALLGSRKLLILDEPTNGLDPAGILEMRSLIQRLPQEQGITVFLSSHLLNEVEQVATHVGILSQGEMVFQGTISELEQMRRSSLRIGVTEIDSAVALLSSRGWNVSPREGYLVSQDIHAAAAINRALVEAGLDVHYLATESVSLEELFLKMTQPELHQYSQ